VLRSFLYSSSLLLHFAFVFRTSYTGVHTPPFSPLSYWPTW